MDNGNGTPDILEELNSELRPELETQFLEQLAILNKIEVTTARKRAAASKSSASTSSKKRPPDSLSESESTKGQKVQQKLAKNSERYIPQFKKKVLDYLNEQSPNTTPENLNSQDSDNWESICEVFKRKPKPIKDVRFKKLSHFPNSISKAARKFDVHKTTISDWVYDTKRQVDLKGLQQIQNHNNTPVINLDNVIQEKYVRENVLEKELIDWLQNQRLQLALKHGKLMKPILDDLKTKLEMHIDYLRDKYENQNYGNNLEEDIWVLEWCIKFKRDVEKAKEPELAEEEDLTFDNEDLEDLSDLEFPTINIRYAFSQVSKRTHCQEEEKILKKDMESIRLKRLREDNEEEDRYINQLQKKLKLNKNAVIPASFRTDGLDYLLEICDKKTTITKNVDPNDESSCYNKDDIENSEMDNSSFDSDESDDDEPTEISKKCTMKKLNLKAAKYSTETDDEDIEADFSDNIDNENYEDGFDNLEEDVDSDEATPHKNVSHKKPNSYSEVWEDIYGRLRDKSGSVIDSKTMNESPTTVPSANKYVPPMKRINDTKREKIMRTLKGLLNRLSEGNMHRISQQVEELYMTNSRNEMNQSMLELFNQSVVQSVSLSDRIILEHIMLVAILHANVGSEVGAYFIQNFVQLFRSKYDEMDDLEDNKELQNLALLISFTYHFKIVNCCLIYDILNFLASQFSPKDIELILTILRSVGFRLRRDDPISLKSVIVLLQQKATSATSGVLNSRVKFMLEILMAIRNNNMNKIPNYDPSFGEHLLKILKSHLSKGNYISEMKISMKDLLNAETKGRWWIVGSAWTNEETTSTETETPNQVEKKMFNQKLLAKAKSQGMNTEIRQNIFCILMTAEDYLDAFEKLSRLSLKPQLEREIIFVVVYCCLQEKKFNPFYPLIAAKFCSFNRKHMLSLQYTLWDRLKDLNNLSDQHRKNMAKLVEYTIKERVLPISILKVIEFADMDKIKLKFLKAVLSGVLLDSEETVLQEIFAKVSMSEKLDFFRESLRLFMGHFMIAQSVDTSDGGVINSKFDPQQLEILKGRVKIAEKALSLGKSRVLL